MKTFKAIANALTRQQFVQYDENNNAVFNTVSKNGTELTEYLKQQGFVFVDIDYRGMKNSAWSLYYNHAAGVGIRTDGKIWMYDNSIGRTLQDERLENERRFLTDYHNSNLAPQNV